MTKRQVEKLVNAYGAAERECAYISTRERWDAANLRRADLRGQIIAALVGKAKRKGKHGK